VVEDERSLDVEGLKEKTHLKLSQKHEEGIWKL